MRRQHFRPSSSTSHRHNLAPHTIAASTVAAPTANDSLTLLHSYSASLNPSRPAKSSPLGTSTINNLPLELLDRLKAFPLFRSAPESFLLSIGQALRPSIIPPNQEIIREGDDAKAMYWLVRGSVRVTSRDGESTYAELKPGAFFGEIGILMGRPRTASIVASVRSLVVRLNQEDLQRELPKYPEVERAIREEALERLAILERKKRERGSSGLGMGAGTDSGMGTSGAGGRQKEMEDGTMPPRAPPRKRSRDANAGDVEMAEAGILADGEVNKRRKSPALTPGTVAEMGSSSSMSDPPLTVRQLLQNMPLFSNLPGDVLHFLGVNAHPVCIPPFTDILKQGSTGRDVYFIIKGDVEVLTEAISTNTPRPCAEQNACPNATALAKAIDAPPTSRVRARLKAGQYFGEVTSLSLAPRRTATVRSVHSVECLLISGDVLDELWSRCSSDLRRQVESEAKRRLKAAAKRDDDVVMKDVGVDDGGRPGDEEVDGNDDNERNDDWRKELPTVKFEDQPPLEAHQQHSPVSQMEPLDPDPLFNAELDNMRSKSRRSSLAPLPPPLAVDGQLASFTDVQRTPSAPNNSLRLMSSSPLKPRSSPNTSPSSPIHLSPTATTTRRPSLARAPSHLSKGRLPDALLSLILAHLDLLDLMRFRLVSTHWWHLLTTSPHILHRLDLSRHNRRVTDDVLRNIIIPFVGTRPTDIDMSNCFHVTDEGFKALAESCGEGARRWKMKSVWDVSGPAVLALVDRAKGLEELDLSNCRKVGDNLLARVVGWVVPDIKPAPSPAQHQQLLTPSPTNGKRQQQQSPKRPATTAPALSLPAPSSPANPPPGTIIGAPHLKVLTLSYCKHIQDRSMAHLALHASARLESLDLTRCTSISDAGFAAWGSQRFPRLRRLVLADCTYLSDAAIVGIVGSCRGLVQLDLSFCCALSDTATEVLSLGLPGLRRLDLAFCGSAVSDNSLRCVGLHLAELRYLSVRGCVRVTGQGVESVVEGCAGLREFDVSQCRNLVGWIEGGGVERGAARGVRFGIVADGTWRIGGGEEG